MRPALLPALIILSVAAGPGCGVDPGEMAAVAAPNSRAVQAAPALQPAPAAATTAAVSAHDAPAAQPGPGLALPELKALHNVYRLGDRILSGNSPEGPASFAELQALGVKTILSVDGATPDVAEAAAHGMRYVHVPVTYSQITAPQQLQIAKVVRDLPGPVYIHCHHGKHRGPAAVASAAVELGLVTPAEGVAFMKQAGTAASYAGLYACVESARPVPAATLDALPDDFPEIARADGLTAAMVQVDEAWEHLGFIRAAGWTVPADHPDLVPAAEAGRLADNFRFGHESPEARDFGDDFRQQLAASNQHAAALEQLLVEGGARAALDEQYGALQAACKSCHVDYRDRTR